MQFISRKHSEAIMQHNFTCVSTCIGKLLGLWQTWFKSFIILNSPQPTFPITQLTGGSPTLSVWIWWYSNGMHGNTIQYWVKVQECVSPLNFSQENMYTHFDDVMRVFPQHNLQTSIQSVTFIVMYGHGTVLNWTGC